MILLKKIGIVEVREQTIQEKGFNLSLKDVKNIYDFEFIKTSHLLEIPQKFQDTQKYDLAINCPGMMRDSNFVRVGSIGLGKEENIEPQEDVFLSYAVILAAKTGTETPPKVTIIKQVLNDTHYRKVQFLHGGTTQDYIMVKDQNELREQIQQKWL
ncbi:MAG: metal ABC transporter substrate-binding protein [Candidatus Phytoplasma asteris]|nr:MAG: metal ABC transporter substrate-binding protein [Candidatus Phytoplasma asteris]